MSVEGVTAEWGQTLKSLSEEIRTTDLSDGEAICGVGKRLDELLEEIPEQVASTEFLISRCLIALQALFQKSSSDADGLRETLCQVLENVNSVSEGDAEGMSMLSDSVDHLEELLLALSPQDAEVGDPAIESESVDGPADAAPAPIGDGADASADAASDPVEGDTDVAAELEPEDDDSVQDEPARTYDLNDVASLMMSIEADDPDGLQAIARALENFTPSAPAPVAEQVSAAAASFSAYLASDGDQAMLGEVGSCIEAAMHLQEDLELSSPEEAPVAPNRSFDLNDIASLMMSVEADDPGGLQAIAVALENFTPDAPEPVAEQVAAAASLFAEYLSDGSSPELLGEVGTRIEEAMRLQEDFEQGRSDSADPREESAQEPDPAGDGFPPLDTPDYDDALLVTIDDTLAVKTDEALALETGDAPAAEIAEAVACPEATEQAGKAGDASEDSAAETGDGGPTSIIPADLDQEMAGEYLTECQDYLEDSEAALLELERSPSDVEAVNRVFRAFHTIKGTSGFLNLPTTAELAHKAENILSKVRDGELSFNSVCAELSLQTVDMLKRLNAVLQNGMESGVGGKPEGYDALMSRLQDPAVLKGEAPSAAAAAVDEAAPGMQAGAGQQQAASATETTVRVKTDRLDRLIDTVGELVIAHSMVAQDPAVSSASSRELGKKVAHASKIVRDLQNLSMGMRMVPFKGTFQKMARLVRDLAVKSGKIVDFMREGEETEIDRNMVDLIGDPLVHMIRNAVDHGIEPPADRAAAGKSESGHVRLAAYHSGGNVIVELRDDGRGMDPQVIFQKAVEKELIAPDASLSDAEIFNLIFEAGFSTAAQVTDVSGRGVGMDVVRRNIEALQGRVEISSTLGQGTVFTIRLPLTMAITDGMLISVGEQRFIVPTLNIELSLRPRREAISTIADKGQMLALRGDQIPLYHLHKIFNIAGAVQEPTEGLVVVMDTGDYRFAMLVDELLGKLQVVAKSLSKDLGRLPGISGGAILGDGRVGLILDPLGLYNVVTSRAGQTAKGGV